MARNAIVSNHRVSQLVAAIPFTRHSSPCLETEPSLCLRNKRFTNCARSIQSASSLRTTTKATDVGLCQTSKEIPFCDNGGQYPSCVAKSPTHLFPLLISSRKICSLWWKDSSEVGCHTWPGMQCLLALAWLVFLKPHFRASKYTSKVRNHPCSTTLFLSIQDLAVVRPNRRSAPDWIKPAYPASRLGTVSGQVQPACYHANPPSAYISIRATDMITSFQVIR